MSTPPGKKVFSARDLAIGFDDPLFTVPEADIYREEKVAIIGANGCGKTTLLRTIVGEHPPLSGTCELGHNVRVATFSQRQEGLHGQERVIDTVLSRASLTISEARGLLGRFLFSGDEVDKKMDALSGGERSRIALALLSLIDGNLLLLDEPTNHLDLASQEILERAVLEYPGTVLLISHDRALLEAVTTQVWLIENGELSVHGYGYTEFRRRRAESQAQGKKADVKNQSAAQSVPSKPKRSSAPSRDTEAKRQVLELEIEALEQKIQDIEQALVAASEAADSPMISSLGIEHEQSQQALTEKYGAWNALSEDQGD